MRPQANRANLGFLNIPIIMTSPLKATISVAIWRYFPRLAAILETGGNRAAKYHVNLRITTIVEITTILLPVFGAMQQFLMPNGNTVMKYQSENVCQVCFFKLVNQALM